MEKVGDGFQKNDKIFVLYQKLSTSTIFFQMHRQQIKRRAEIAAAMKANVRAFYFKYLKRYKKATNYYQKNKNLKFIFKINFL